MFGRQKLMFKFEVNDKTDDTVEDSEKKKFYERKKEEKNTMTFLESCTSEKLTDISHKSGKMKLEMRAPNMRPSASQQLLSSVKLSQERSFGGKVMKKIKGGTPKKIKNVEKLKKCFETRNEKSSLRKGWVGL